jgi:hypothetical protein
VRYKYQQFLRGRIMKRFIFSAVLGIIISTVVYAYSEGSGTSDDPYIISNADDWQQLMNNSSDWGASFIMGADVNLAGLSLTPVGNNSIWFSGVFDGNSHVISNADINLPSSDCVGLFGIIITQGQVKNLGVENATITGHSYVGGLVGFNAGSISNCYSKGQVNGGYECGGLVGENLGSINNCHSTGQVSGSSTSECIGGLVGKNDGGIINCYSTVQVSAPAGSIGVGGLVGGNSNSINNCYSTGQVSAPAGSIGVGGLVGSNDSSISLTNCYSTGQVSGSSCIGGLVGENEVSISNCYSTGQVSGSEYVGGLVGRNFGTIVGSFWDIQTSGQTTSSGGTGENTAEMKTKSTFTNAGWDLVSTWSICEVTNYPRLLWQIPTADFVCPDGVDFADYSFFAEHWMNTDCAGNNNCNGTDLDLSGTVDWNDLRILCLQWLEGVGQ